MQVDLAASDQPCRQPGANECHPLYRPCRATKSAALRDPKERINSGEIDAHSYATPIADAVGRRQIGLQPRPARDQDYRMLQQDTLQFRLMADTSNVSAFSRALSLKEPTTHTAGPRTLSCHP